MDYQADTTPLPPPRLPGRGVTPLGRVDAEPSALAQQGWKNRRRLPPLTVPEQEDWEPLEQDPRDRLPRFPQPSKPRRRKSREPRGRFRRALRFTAVISVVAFAASLVATFAYIWITPPRTSYMLQAGEPIVYQYVSLDHVSRCTVASVVAHEDEELGTRVGAFSGDDFAARAQAFASGQPDPSGSTVPQQLVKNIFLWPSHDPLRKGIEAGLSTEFALIVPKQRIMELYLNYAQFGPKLFGICAASWYYYSIPPSKLTDFESAQLMGVLPDPDNVRRAPGGGLDIRASASPEAVELINGAANVWVPRQLAGMGGWQAAVKTIGITDTAADHAATEDNPDGCSRMPQDVAKRLQSAGVG
ncbi:transglycosylase domain-containing protein [Sinomonas gamaensis]|uniref:transglycosylase domain-containing protein n=1 Tax=Sinomonas gamaensis TaxID=2565624 RepID=UPI001109A681|nr:transglycosylase domain-containing protein [Sinomonas gamaensis]